MITPYRKNEMNYSISEDDRDDTSELASERNRKQTAKGKQYQIQLLEDQRSSAQRSWRKQLNRIENCLADFTEPAKLQSERTFLESKMELLVSAHDRFVDVLEDLEAKRITQQKFDLVEQEHSDALKRLNQKISELKQEKESLLSSVTATSSRPSKVAHGAKSHSSKSSRTSTAIDRKADTAVKVAKLKTELHFADGEATKIAELKKFKLTKELAIAEAEMNAINKVEESELNSNNGKELDLPDVINKDDLLQGYLTTQASFVTKNSLSTMETDLSEAPETNPQKTPSQIAATSQVKPKDPKTEISKDALSPTVNYPSPLNPFAPEYVAFSTPKTVENTSSPLAAFPYAHADQSTPNCTAPAGDQNKNSQNQTNGDALERLADLITQRHARELLPLPEPETFKGDLLHYPSWKKSFDAIVERRTDSPSQRLYYLGRYTSGEAKDAISGLLTLESDDAYREARKILSDRFGNPFLVADAYKKKIKEWPNIPPNDGTSLRKFSDFLVHCQTAMKEIHYLKALNDPEENQKMVRKLPRNICDRWGREVDYWLSKKEQKCESSRCSESAYPPFSAFCDFLKREARIACNPVALLRVVEDERKAQQQQRSGRFNSSPKNKPFGAKTFATGSEEVKGGRKGDKKPPERCRLCKNAHGLDECDKFAKMPHTERMEVVKSNGLCLGCLRYGHMKKDCRGRKICATCKGFHPTALHVEAQKVPQKDTKPEELPRNTEDAQATSCRVNTYDSNNGSICNSHSLIVPIWLHHADNPERKELVYALLDNQSDACFVKDEILRKLDISGPDIQLKLSTILGEDLVASQRITDLIVRGVNEQSEVSLPRTYSRDEIPAKRGQIPRPESVSGWPHLQSIAEHLTPYQHDISVGLLIGANCAKAIKPREVIPGGDDDPYAVRTTLGWGVIGIMNPTTGECQDNTHCSCNRIVSREIQDSGTRLKTTSHLVVKTQAKEVFAPAQLSKMLELDFRETSKEEQTLSLLDRKFLNVMESNIKYQDDGHYEIPLPLKEEGLTLPNNRNLALSRLEKLKQRLKRT